MVDERGSGDEPQDPSDWLAAQFGSDHEPEEASPEPSPSQPDDADDTDDAAAVTGFDPIEPAAPAMAAAPPLWPPVPLAVPLEPEPTTARLPSTPSAPTEEPVPPPELIEPPASEHGGFVWGLLPSSSAISPVNPPTETSVIPSAEPPFDASLAGGPSAGETPTVAMPWEGTPTELFAPAVSEHAVAEPATELLGGVAAAASIEGLLGESQFHEPETVTGGFGRATTAAEKPRRAPIPRTQKIVLWVAGVLVALLALAVLYFLGTRLPQLGAEAPVVKTTTSATPSATPSPTPTPVVIAVGPVAPGAYKWNKLLGGECLEPFESAWAEKYTVVECTQSHHAQMVARGSFAVPAADSTATPAPVPYPGLDALQAQVNLLCTAPTVINFPAASAYPDIQISGSYAATEKEWTDGDRSYFCFVTRSSGDPLTTSVAVAPAA